MANWSSPMSKQTENVHAKQQVTSNEVFQKLYCDEPLIVCNKIKKHFQKEL